MEMYEVIVIGGGIMGSASAYYLSKHFGGKVLLIEQFDFLHRRGSSHGDSRIIRMTYPQEHYTALMGDAYKLWAAAEKESGTKVFTKTGGLDFAQRNNQNMRSLVKTAHKYKIDCKVLSSDEVNKRFPTVTIPEDHIGVYSPDAGILNATKAVAMFQNLAKANGCILRDNTVVTEINQDKRQGQAQWNSRLCSMLGMKCKGKQMLTKVTTSQGQQFLCNNVVITTGAWSKKFLLNVGVDLPLRPIQTTVAYWKVDSPADYSSSVFPVFINYEKESFVYGFPAHEFPNMLKCCAHYGTDVDPDKRDFLPGTEALENDVAPFIRRTFHGVSPVAEKTESCMYTVTPDEDFIIDQLPSSPKIIIGCGFSGHGFKLAPIVGQILSQLVISGVHPYPHVKKHFSIDRFKPKSKI